MKKKGKIITALCAAGLLSISFCVGGVVGNAYGVSSIQATKQDAEALLNDNNTKVNLGKSQKLPQIQDEGWAEIVNASKPLTIGETYVEDWSRSITNTRLKPYEITTAPDEAPGATYEYKTTANGKSVVVTTNGEVGGAFDYIKFAGMRYVEDALYTVTVDYTTLTADRTWKVGFEHNYFMDLPSGEVGEQKQAVGEFSASSQAGYNGNLNYSLIFLINGGEESAQLQVDKITITRLQDRPSVKNARIAGTHAVGSTLRVVYDVVLGDGVNLTNTDISWFITTNSNCTDMTVLNEFDGRKSITVPTVAEGKYVGCILKPYSDSEGSSGVGQNHIVLGKAVGEVVSYSNFRFQKVGDTFQETFDELESDYNMGITADVGVDAFATGKDAINGKSLYVNNKTTEMKGGYFTGLKFKGGMPYSISFKLKLLHKPSALYVQFRALSSLGYDGDIKYQVITPTMTDGGTYECYIPAMKLMDASDYELQIFSVGAGEYLIDDFSLTMLSPTYEMDSLKTVGGMMTEDFDSKNILTNIDTFGWGGVTYDTHFDGYGLVLQSKQSGSTTLYFYDFIDKLQAGGTYKVSFEYMIKSDNAPQDMYVGVRSMEDGYQSNVKFDCTGNAKDTKYTWSNTFTLANKEDMFLQIFNMAGDGSIIVIDNITITNVTSSDTQKLSDLDVVGGKLTHNFDDKMILGSFISSTVANSVVAKDNAIEGESLTLDNTTNAPTVMFLFNNKLALNGQYKVTLDYKVLTSTAPSYFCVGFNGTAQTNKENWFSGRSETVGQTYQFEHTFTLGQGEYYLQIFNLFADGSKIVIDNIVIEKIS